MGSTHDAIPAVRREEGRSGLTAALLALAEAVQKGDESRYPDLLTALEPWRHPEWNGEAITACAALTNAIADSTPAVHKISPDDWFGIGEVTDLATTGGPGLKSSFVVSTWLALCGKKVPKMATGGGKSKSGTIDLLAALGASCSLERDGLMQQVKRHGLAFCRPDNFAPADAALMRSRRELGLMNHTPLVIASILAKKKAAGVKRFTVELRAGRDSKTGDSAQTRRAADAFVQVARAADLDVLAVVTNSDLLATHALGAPVLAWECLRHLAGAVRPHQGESGLLWDRAHRQCLELLALAGWWADGAEGDFTRDILNARVKELGEETSARAEEVWQMLNSAVSAQGGSLPPMPRNEQGWEALLGHLTETSSSVVLEKRPVFAWALNPRNIDEWWKRHVDTLAGARLRVDRESAELEVFPRGAHETGSYRFDEVEDPNSELPPALVLGAVAPVGSKVLPLRIGERVLLGTLGEAAGVVTETLDALKNRAGVTIDRVVILFTRFSQTLAGLDPLRCDLWARTSEELPSREEFDDRLLAGGNTGSALTGRWGTSAVPCWKRAQLALVSLSVDDVRTVSANKELLEHALSSLNREAHHVDVWGEDCGHVVHVSVAGGRKTMSALAFFASSLFRVEGAYHVLVNCSGDLRGVYHVPERLLDLSPLPRLPFDSLLQHAKGAFKMESLAQAIRGNRFDEWFAKLSGEAEKVIEGALREREKMLSLRDEALQKLRESCENPLLGKLRLAFVSMLGERCDLAARVRGELTNDLAMVEEYWLEPSGKAVAPDPQEHGSEASVCRFGHSIDDLWWARFDAVLVTEKVLLAPSFNIRAPLCPVPMISLSEKDDVVVRVSRYLLQRSRAFHWVDPRELVRLPKVLHDLLEDLHEERQRFAAELEVNGLGSDASRALLLQRLFTGHVYENLEVTQMQGGFSASGKLHVRPVNQTRPYFVKVAAYESVAREQRNYQMWVRGASENFSGRIEWRPARNNGLGAIAYSRVGGTSDELRSLLDLFRNDPKRVNSIIGTEVLDKVEAFHNKPRIETLKPNRVEQWLEPLLPARVDMRFDTVGDPVKGVLFEVVPEDRKLQLLVDGRKVNIRGIPRKMLEQPRLVYGRTIVVPAVVAKDLSMVLCDRLIELFPEAEAAPLRDHILRGETFDGYWKSLVRSDIYVGTCHGDLNLDNIQLQSGKDGKAEGPAWFIDFATTGEGPVLYDYAKLEIESWTNIFPVIAEQEELDRTWRGLFSHVREVYSTHEGQTGTKFAWFAGVVRKMGERAERWSGDGSSAYDLFRAAYALNTCKFLNLDDKSASQPIEARYAGRRIGIVLAAWFLKGHPRFRTSWETLERALNGDSVGRETFSARANERPDT